MLGSKNKLYIALALLLLGGAFCIGLFPCRVRTVLGIPCPSCGMTRAYKALLTGDIRLAFQMHPLFWLPPAIAVLCYFKRGLLRNKWFWMAAIALLLLVYAIRMALLFPHTEPMTYNEHNLFNTLWKGFFIP